MRPRMRAEDVESALADIIEALGSHTEGLGAQQLREMTGQEKPLFVKVIKLGLESHQLKKTGDRRSTAYFLPSAGAVAQTQGRVIKKKRAL